MRVKYIINDYLLAWNLLFRDSITKDLNDLKRKLWINYKNEYNNISYDKDQILKDYKNFIPDNDTIYNIIMNSKDFNTIKRQLEKKKIHLIKSWDKHQKLINDIQKNVVRKDEVNYNCLLISDFFNIHETIKQKNNNLVILGKEFKTDADLLINLLFEIMKKEIKIEINDELGIKDAIIEMLILNEFGTRIKKTSCYKDGNKDLFYLKKQIYPYWLMYLGIPRENMVEYMLRDKIAFETKSYAYEKELINLNIEEFIEFIIRNKRYIVREDRQKDDYVLI